LGSEGELVSTGADDTPREVVAEQFVRCRYHVVQVILIGTDPTVDPHHELDVDRRFQVATFEEMLRIVEVTHIVTFEFRNGAVLIE
jgi:hypothetical protein